MNAFLSRLTAGVPCWALLLCANAHAQPNRGRDTEIDVRSGSQGTIAAIGLTLEPGLWGQYAGWMNTAVYAEPERRK